MTVSLSNVVICQQCVIATAGAGALAEGVRPACPRDGGDIGAHAEAGDCPDKKHGKPAETPATPALTFEPEPFDAWPVWAKAIALARADADAGVGDTVHRELGFAGLAFKAAMVAIGAPCGCDTRHAEWNARYPYTALDAPGNE